ncbi:MAG: hypothetical protein IJM30_10300 [Thermoguttaceae bacterium]|nr:hypothetical protein [Thermoguttaceae bacterium]
MVYNPTPSSFVSLNPTAKFARAVIVPEIARKVNLFPVKPTSSQRRDKKGERKTLPLALSSDPSAPEAPEP